MRLHPIDSWNPSPRVTIRRRDRIRVIGTGGDLGRRFAGTFRVAEVYQARTRTYLEIVGQDKTGGTFTIYVAGKPYRRHGLKWKPYKIRRAK